MPDLQGSGNSIPGSRKYHHLGMCPPSAPPTLTESGDWRSHAAAHVHHVSRRMARSWPAVATHGGGRIFNFPGSRVPAAQPGFAADRHGGIGAGSVRKPVVDRLPYAAGRRNGRDDLRRQRVFLASRRFGRCSRRAMDRSIARGVCAGRALPGAGSLFSRCPPFWPARDHFSQPAQERVGCSFFGAKLKPTTVAVKKITSRDAPCFIHSERGVAIHVPSEEFHGLLQPCDS